MFPLLPTSVSFLPRKGIQVTGGTLSMLQPIAPLRAFKVTVFLHGWKINGVCHEKENAPVSRKAWEQQYKHLLCIFLSSSQSKSLIALFSYWLPLHCISLLMKWINHSGNVKACLVPLLCRSKMKQRHMQSMNTLPSFLPCKPTQLTHTCTPTHCIFSCPCPLSAWYFSDACLNLL